MSELNLITRLTLVIYDEAFLISFWIGCRIAFIAIDLRLPPLFYLCYSHPPEAALKLA
jgi:hypothetical protein